MQIELNVLELHYLDLALTEAKHLHGTPAINELRQKVQSSIRQYPDATPADRQIQNLHGAHHTHLYCDHANSDVELMEVYDTENREIIKIPIFEYEKSLKAKIEEALQDAESRYPVFLTRA